MRDNAYLLKLTSSAVNGTIYCNNVFAHFITNLITLIFFTISAEEVSLLYVISPRRWL